MKAKSGFTLVEILIVVVILGILAAIVIPQFTEAGEEARLSSLASDLQTMRGQLELYEIQHNDSYPAQGTFEDQMCNTTDINGNTNTPASKERTGLFVLGPYLQVVPVNPFTNSNTVVGWGAGVAGTDGWEYNAATGEFRAAPDTTADTAAHQAL